MAAWGGLIRGILNTDPKAPVLFTCERAALNVGGAQFVIPRLFDERIGVPGKLGDGLIVGILKHRNDKSLVSGHGYAEVDLVFKDNPVVLPGRVDLGCRAQDRGHRLKDERQVGELHALSTTKLLLQSLHQRYKPETSTSITVHAWGMSCALWAILWAMARLTGSRAPPVAAAATPFPAPRFSTACRTSALVIRPPAPVPCSEERSMPCSSASLRTRGE